MEDKNNKPDTFTAAMNVARPRSAATPASSPSSPTIPNNPPSLPIIEPLTPDQFNAIATSIAAGEPVAASQSAEAINAARPRTATKTMEAVDQTSPAARIAASAKSFETPAPAPEQVVPTLFMFISHYPELRLYVNFGHMEQDIKGQEARRNFAVQFTNGTFSTNSPILAQKLRDHPRCNTGLFREEGNTKAVAIRAAAASARATLRSATYAGATSSTDGSAGIFHHQDHELADVENRLFRL
jgi:hypothetical protein